MRSNHVEPHFGQGWCSKQHLQAMGTDCLVATLSAYTWKTVTCMLVRFYTSAHFCCCCCCVAVGDLIVTNSEQQHKLLLLQMFGPEAPPLHWDADNKCSRDRGFPSVCTSAAAAADVWA
jgi:hypothetical protein